MDQDPFPGTRPDAGQGYGHDADSAEREAAAAPRFRHAGTSATGTGSQQRHPDDTGRIRAFLEDQLRQRPLPTLLLGVLAGWLAGKLLR